MSPVRCPPLGSPFRSASDVVGGRFLHIPSPSPLSPPLFFPCLLRLAALRPVRCPLGWYLLCLAWWTSTWWVSSLFCCNLDCSVPCPPGIIKLHVRSFVACMYVLPLCPPHCVPCLPCRTVRNVCSLLAICCLIFSLPTRTRVLGAPSSSLPKTRSSRRSLLTAWVVHRCYGIVVARGVCCVSA
jgi:hypothetical protein